MIGKRDKFEAVLKNSNSVHISVPRLLLHHWWFTSQLHVRSDF